MRIGIAIARAEAVAAVEKTLGESREHVAVWATGSGEEALRLCRENPPDLVLMGLRLTGSDGREATRRIVEETGTAVLIVTSSVSGSAAHVFEAMGHGALDAVTAPVLSTRGTVTGGKALLEKIATIERLLGRPGGPGRAVAGARTAGRRSVIPLVAVGASTGGPKALAELIAGFPKDFEAGVVVVQHVDSQFSQGMAHWLSIQTGKDVAIARRGDRVSPGKVLVAGGEGHLVMGPDQLLAYTREPEDSPYHPSVDAFFMSLARNWWPVRAVACLLTGMGKDGAQGLARLRRAGWHTIAQDEATSVVYGMPKAAVELNAACEVQPIGRIAFAVVRALRSIRSGCNWEEDE